MSDGTEEIPQQVKQRHGYRITTAWVSQAGETPWLLNAYDEATEDAWGGPPDFFTEAVTKARGQGDEVRIVHLFISYEAVAERFVAGMTEAEVSGRTKGDS